MVRFPNQPSIGIYTFMMYTTGTAYLLLYSITYGLQYPFFRLDMKEYIFLVRFELSVQSYNKHLVFTNSRKNLDRALSHIEKCCKGCRKTSHRIKDIYIWPLRYHKARCFIWSVCCVSNHFVQYWECLWRKGKPAKYQYCHSLLSLLYTVHLTLWFYFPYWIHICVYLVHVIMSRPWAIMHLIWH